MSEPTYMIAATFTEGAWELEVDAVQEGGDATRMIGITQATTLATVDTMVINLIRLETGDQSVEAADLSYSYTVTDAAEEWIALESINESLSTAEREYGWYDPRTNELLWTWVTTNCCVVHRLRDLGMCVGDMAEVLGLRTERVEFLASWDPELDC